jgi:signal peptidase II
LRARIYIITALLLCTLDQLSKLAAERFLKLGQPIEVIPRVFNFQLNYNPGIAFGLFSNYTTFFALVALVMVIVITWLIRSSHKDQRLFRWALTFQLGGALGNLLDRSLREKGVVDFLDFYIKLNGKTHTWPTFNLADAFVVVGTFFLVVYLIKAPPPELAQPVKVAVIPFPPPEGEEQELEEVILEIGHGEGLEELHTVDEPREPLEPDGETRPPE